MTPERHRKRTPPRKPLLLSRLTFLSALALASCAHHAPSWTPETVSPPASFEQAVTAVSQRSGDSSPSTAPAPEEPPPRNTPEPLTLSRDEAIVMAFERNRDMAVERYNPRIDQTAIPEARAAFDPKLSITTTYSERNAPLVESDSAPSSYSNAQYGATTGQNETGILAVLSSAQNVVEQAQTTLESIESLTSSDIQKTEQTDAQATISEFLPTGTTISLNGGFTHQDISTSEDPDYSGNWSVGVTQSLLRGFGPAVNLVALRQARNTAAISEHAFRDFALAFAEEVEIAYWEFALAQETLRIQEFSVNLAKEQLKLNETMIAVGKLPGSDIVAAQAELAAQQANLVNAQADVKRTTITLWRLLNPENRLPDEVLFSNIEIPGASPLQLAPEESVELALVYRPDLAQARLNLANRELDVIQTKNGLLPVLDAFVSYGRDSTGVRPGDWSKNLDSSDYDNFQVGLTFEVSLGNRAERAQHRRAVFRQDQAEASILNLEQAIEAEVRKAIVEVERQRQSIEATRLEVAQREEELRIETDQFRLGRSTNLDVLQVQRDLIQAKVDEATAKVRHVQAVSALYGVEGTLLARRGIAMADELEKNT